MKILDNKQFFVAVIVATAATNAMALEHRIGDFNFGLSGYGTAGIFEPDFNTPDFLGDFRVRAQITYDGVKSNTFGAVYTMDEIALNEDNFYHEAFAFWHIHNIARLEIGLTESAAHKLGLGLPDAGGLRINHDSLIFRKMGTGGAIIANPTITNGSEAPRVSIVSATHKNAQYGISVAGLTDSYDYEVDAGLKLKYSEAKTKYAFSFGASFMSHPDDFSTDTFSPNVSADWRGQIYSGLNIQYNSFVFGLTGRLIYDENPIGIATDGIVAGTGVSYDILNYTISATYMFSETGIWHDADKNYIDHTALASFRYKYSKYIDGWMSVGMSRKEPFVAAGIRASF